MQFTHKLSYEEQERLTQPEREAYWDWLFRVNEAVCRKREHRDERTSDQQYQRECALDVRDEGTEIGR